jgi:amino acid transporter
VWSIVFFVMSAAAPLTVVISGAPLTVALGGIGGPGAMLAAGVVLLLFAVGFTAMSQHITNAGAFYAYVTQGLGRAMGSGVAVMTTAGYTLLLISLYGFVGYYAHNTAEKLFGINLPWWLWALAIAALIAILGVRQVDVGARVLAVLLTAEVAIILAVSIAVLIKGGPEPISLAPFNPHYWLLAPGAGTLLVLGFGAYIGFEGTAIYAEEAKRPHRTVPRATYIAIGFLAVFYAFAFWCFILAFGVNGVQAAVTGEDFGELPFVQVEHYLGGVAVKTAEILIVTSFVAGIIAFHNAAARYLFSLGRGGLLPSWLAHTHPVHHSPARASYLLSAVSVIAILVALVFGWDPFIDLGNKPYSTAVIAIVAAQAICAIAVVAYFARNRRGFSVGRALVAPALGAAGLLGGTWLIVSNFEIVSGYSGVVNVILLSVAPTFFVIGVIGHFLTHDRAAMEPAEDTALPSKI